MFSKILIANRGEIACRVIKTANRLGIKTVAVYSEADRDALHVEMADEAFLIGPPPATQSYLLTDKIVAVCKETGAEAVHPGYGFLSENASFAQALADAGIAFIGPNIRAIEIMGDKIESKRFAADAKVNTVPGYIGLIESPAEAARIAEDIGYPIMIKASAGGGGKGMRIAFTSDDVEIGFKSAVSEAKASFGDDRIFVEKFVEQPRHIEIQVMGDKHGNAVYFGERECSIQRRNQKVLEEAPSPFLDEATRARMGEQAVALAKAVSYESAGTVEFIVDKDKNFYFLEMNTRLQVEHPVTELITGVDLVEQMIRVAAGEPLAMTQDDIKLTGWAIESRIYAEDPFRNFLPSTGRLTRYRPPKEGTQMGLTVRNDTGVYEGGEISIYYDPMIAKLVVHGPDRASAIDHMARALDAFYIDGIQHNIPFLSAIMQHPRWRSGNITTAFIDEEYPEGFQHAEANESERRSLVAVAAAIDYLSNQRRRRITHQMHGEPVRFSQERTVVLGGIRQDVHVDGVYDGPTEITLLDENGAVQGRVHAESDWWFGQPIWFGTLDGITVAVQVRPILNGYDLSFRGIHLPAYIYSRREAELAALMPIKEPPDTSMMLLCPMPGLLVSLAVEVGQEIKTGEVLCTVEAMKMENVLRAERDATVATIEANPGDTLAVDEVIMTFS